jgi:hypothetical protein
MQEFFRAAVRALDTGEAVHGISVIKEPAHDTLRHIAQRTAGMLEMLFVGADKVPPKMGSGRRFEFFATVSTI